MRMAEYYYCINVDIPAHTYTHTNKQRDRQTYKTDSKSVSQSVSKRNVPVVVLPRKLKVIIQVGAHNIRTYVNRDRSIIISGVSSIFLSCRG